MHKEKEQSQRNDTANNRHVLDANVVNGAGKREESNAEL
jgi:hypothetical protein